MAEVNIPTGPVERDPHDAIRADWPRESWDGSCSQALLDALDGIELGDYDRQVVAWLVQVGAVSGVATVCSWLLRVRAAAAEGHAEEIAALRAQLPECNGLCLRASDVLFDMSHVNGNPVARAHRSCPLHGDLEAVARELSAALTAAEQAKAAEGCEPRG